MVSGLDAETLEAAQKAYEKVDPDNLKVSKDKEDAPVVEEKQDTGEEEVVDEKVEDKVDEEKEEKPDEDKEKKSRTDDEIVDIDDKDLTETELKRKKEIVEFQASEEKRVLETDDSKLSAEDLEFKKEILKSKQEKEEAVSPEKEFEEEVKTYAKEHNMTDDEVLAEIEASKGIVNKYKGNALKVARANLHLQKTYSKTANELKELKELVEAPKEVPASHVKSMIESGNLVIRGERLTKSRVVELYRADNPKVSEMLDDDAVLELAAQRIADVNNGNINSSKIDIAEKAKSKRSELISKITARGKKYLPEIKSILDVISDRAVVNDNFNISEIENMVLGTKVSEIEEAAYQRGLKEGKEKTRIVRIPVAGSSPSKVSKGSTISEEDRKLASRMFGDMSEDEAITNFLKIKPHM